MVINGKALLEATPIEHMHNHKIKLHGVSHGLGEAGYDIRIKQTVEFRFTKQGCQICIDGKTDYGTRFVLASAIERFQMPNNLVGVVHDKSTWARRGLSVFNTVIEPGWEGFLTLELVYHGNDSFVIPAGAGIAQVIFSQVSNPSQYGGKYQHQADEPVAAILQY
jgi:dCTP deaminase